MFHLKVLSNVKVLYYILFCFLFRKERWTIWQVYSITWWQ